MEDWKINLLLCVGWGIMAIILINTAMSGGFQSHLRFFVPENGSGNFNAKIEISMPANSVEVCEPQQSRNPEIHRVDCEFRMQSVSSKTNPR